jgi:radical SAM superfamily enzyme YgiQ (UPF0313 family)
MPSRVLLISANRYTTPDAVFPVGLAQLTGALRRAGHAVRWHDLLASTSPLENVLEEFRPELAGISLRNIDDVLIRKQETFYDAASDLFETIKARAGCPVVLGGSGFSIFPRELMRLTGADFGVCGAGERALVALTDALAQKQDPSGIPGLLFRRNGDLLQNPPIQTPLEPSHLEDRPREIVEYYLRNGGILNVQTQRGCRFQCCYCTYPVIEGRSNHRHPADDIAEEFAQLQQLGAKYVFIVDSIFNSSPRHVHEICEAILRRNLKISWGCFLRPQGLNAELVRLMARAGLSHVEFGSDSFSDTVLAAYHKGLTFADILNSSELLRQEKLDFCHFLICGGPGETQDTLNESFENSRHLHQAVVMAVIGMRIYPGTELFSRALNDGLVTPNTDLLPPKYFLAPGLTAEFVYGRLQEFAARSKNWVIGDPSPDYAALVARLRARGMVGPLWSYVSMFQRLFPQGLPGSAQP